MIGTARTLRELSVSPRRVRVWDLPTRIFHWLLVLAVGVALWTGFIAPEWWLGLHRGAGYAIVLLLAFRFVWAFYGSEYSRLTYFIRASRHFGDYLRGLLLLRPPHYVGHNPVGALMVFALFAMLIALVASGLLVEGGEEKRGPLAGLVAYQTGFVAKGLHRILVYLLLSMILVHIAGVLVESRLQRASLVRGMITGWMRVPEGMPMPSPRPAHPLRAAVALGLFTSVAAGVLLVLSRIAPPGIPDLAPNATVAAECGACHWPYHPSLLPRTSWAALLAGLEDHFGEDASLPADTLAEIATYYERYAAEAWDSEAARRFATVSPNEPLRITDTPYWVAKHAGLDPAVFDAPAVRSKSNCIACHRDADSGRFDDQAIALPKGASP